MTLCAFRFQYLHTNLSKDLSLPAGDRYIAVFTVHKRLNADTSLIVSQTRQDKVSILIKNEALKRSHNTGRSVHFLKARWLQFVGNNCNTGSA